MRRFFILPLLLFLVFSSSCAQKEEIPAFPADSVVKVLCSDGEKEYVGRGAHMSGGYVVTAAHIFPASYHPGDLCTIEHRTGIPYESEILFLSRDYDLALLSCRVEGGSLPSNNLPTYGYAPSKSGDGYVKTSIRAATFSDGKVRLLLDASFQKGDSGAPVFDKTGAVIGIIVSRDKNGRYACAVPISDLFDGFSLSLCAESTRDAIFLY